MSKRRVVITGLGAVTGIGNDATSTWQAALAGSSGVSYITRFDTSEHPSKIASELKGFDPEKWIEPKDIKRFDPYARYALAAASMALEDSGLELEKEDRTLVGVVLGSGIGGLTELEEQKDILAAKGPRRVSPFLVPKMMINAASGQIAIRWNLMGPNYTTGSACASAAHAIGCALDHIRQGLANVIVTGGAEATITPLCMAGFHNMKALCAKYETPEQASRPFDKDRNGFVMGEGAGMLIFEELEHAKKRNAKIYAEVLGFGMSDDGYHLTAPDPEAEGPARAIRLALKDSNCTKEDITYVNAHGTSTPYNDKIETYALKKVFEDHAPSLAISSSKSLFGHMLGASGGAELVMCAYSVAESKVHPTINYTTPDPECDLDYVPNEARDLEINAAISNSFGFGGHNATIVIGKLRND